MNEPREQQVKAIQINIALGSRQRVDVLVDRRVTRDLCRQPAEFHNEGLTSVQPDLVTLVCQLGDKLCEALRNRAEAITVQVEGVKVIPDVDDS